MPVDAGVLTAAERDDLAAQLRPRPPIALGPVAAGAGATAMMDVSDGLLLDATRLAEASRVSIDLDAGMDADDLRGGEGHALLACFPPEVHLPAGFRAVGRVAPREGSSAVTVGGAPVTGHLGWDPHRDWDAGRG